MTRSYHPHTTTRRSRPVVLRSPRNPAITRLGFTMFRFEGDWPVVVMSSRNAMMALTRL